ncbi:DsbA family protein [Prauserella cavernicola]|uniref:Thioredoxin domain-containing protein n=1 Tax=Prauserella cavernicola TaxID=2800127 RepID=A0A934QW60_9PSEU|nr:thioredoxin domain-containing protein [Prauserella cavernicola]MBK1787641.1 thioredoxin domain-containing protein [Prauserella cavernicola]
MTRTTRNPVTARSRLSPNVLITLVVLVVAALVFGGVLLTQRGDDDVTPDSLRGPDANTVLDAGDEAVTIVEFLDYQCPACAGYYSGITRQLEEDYAGRITFVVRNFPLQAHPLARQAAAAAEAAALQGRFAEMYRALYDNFTGWALAPGGQSVSDDTGRAAALFDDYARTAGLDVERFRRDITSDEVRSRIEADLAAGREAGVTGTPTIFVDGTRFEPAGSSYADVAAELRSLLDDRLNP